MDNKVEVVNLEDDAPDNKDCPETPEDDKCALVRTETEVEGIGAFEDGLTGVDADDTTELDCEDIR